MFGADRTLSDAQSNLSKAGIPTLAAQGQYFNQDVAMAQLTGFLPDGTPTNEYQQQQLANLWTLADQTGVIPNELADMYKIPRGTPTQAAKQYAMDYALQSRQVNASIANMNADNARQNDNISYNKFMDMWKVTGKAPSDMPAYGIKKGDPYPTTTSGNSSINAKESANNLSQAKGYIDSLNKNDAMTYAQGIADYLTDSDYRSLLNYIDDNL